MKEYCGVKVERMAWVVNLLRSGVEEVGVVPRTGALNVMAVMGNGDGRLVYDADLSETREQALVVLMSYLLVQVEAIEARIRTAEVALEEKKKEIQEVRRQIEEEG